MSEASSPQHAQPRCILTLHCRSLSPQKVCTQALVLATYVRAKQVPAWSLLLLLISKRMHSVYVLRLFNDCVAMLFAYASVYIFTHRSPPSITSSLGEKRCCSA